MAKRGRTSEERHNIGRIIKMFLKSMLIGMAVMLSIVWIYQLLPF
jgi:hypothetical protein